MIAHALKFRSLPARAGELLAKDLLTTCFSESLHLQVQILVQGRHPRVADVHNLAPDRGKSPCKRMNVCNRLLQTKISSKTPVSANAAEVTTFALLRQALNGASPWRRWRSLSSSAVGLAARCFDPLIPNAELRRCTTKSFRGLGTCSA